MTFNTSAMNDAAESELAANVQDWAVQSDLSDGHRQVAQTGQPQVEAGLRGAAASVLMGTQALFPGQVSLAAVDDPKIFGSRYLTVSCQSYRSVEEIVVAFNQWHAKLKEWAPGLEHLFRLSVDAIE